MKSHSKPPRHPGLLRSVGRNLQRLAPLGRTGQGAKQGVDADVVQRTGLVYEPTYISLRGTILIHPVGIVDYCWCRMGWWLDDSQNRGPMSSLNEKMGRWTARIGDLLMIFPRFIMIYQHLSWFSWYFHGIYHDLPMMLLWVSIRGRSWILWILRPSHLKALKETP